jgi:uncharacterized OsmC-like protein
LSPSIESLATPLAYKASFDGAAPTDISEADEAFITVKSRSLEGMQKEALVHTGATGAAGASTTWRLTSDEGPYLNGTDLAPFPLAFFTSGMVMSFASNLRAIAQSQGVKLGNLQCTLDNFYTMEGSALRGTMTGSALPAELHVSADGIADAELKIFADAAMRWSPVSAFLGQELVSEFSTHLNGALAPVDGVKPTMADILPAPGNDFDLIAPITGAVDGVPILSKVSAAEQLVDVAGGVGSSLKSEQKRMLHVRGVLKIAANGLFDVRIQLLKPIGSVFQFFGDDPVHRGGQARAPSGLDYLSAGVAFCFMTQLERYAQIVKQDLQSCELIQLTRFRAPSPSLEPGAAEAFPAVTHVYLTSGEDLAHNQKLVQMGEQTCFLHAALRASNPVVVSV